MERKTTIQRNGKKYYFDIIFKQENYLNYPFTGGYYLTGVPMIEEVGLSGRKNTVKGYEFEVLELLVEYEKPDDEGLKVASKVADKHVDSVIVQIEQNIRDKKLREETAREEMEKEMKDVKDIIEKLKETKQPPSTPSTPDIFSFFGGIDGFNTPSIDTKKTNKDKDEELEKPKTRLDDVAGLEEIKLELKEVIEGFTRKEEYKRFKLKPVNGILLYGEPGNGKSLISRALAGETNATFIEMAGSEFIEKYVGVGAKRVRELFAKARKNRPCIVFIDEIDAIGSRREEENNKEGNATLNQLLTELSSTDNDDIVVIGATNRKDILDPALLRQGRLGKHIFVGNPSKQTRQEILELYVKDRPMAKDVDLSEIARRTHGCSGADMEAIINEACLYALRENAEEVSQEMMYKAIDRIQVGIQNKSRELVEREKDIVCYHESSHMIVGMKTGGNKISKISMISTGDALGYVSYYSEEDKFIRTKEELEGRIMTSLAGAVGEEVFFGHMSSGCSGDLNSVSAVARAMVTEYGMSERIGKMAISKNDVFMQEVVHEEMKKIVDECYAKTKALVEENKGLIEYIAKELKEKETIEGEEAEQLVASYIKAH